MLKATPPEQSLKQREMLTAYKQDVKYRTNHEGYWYSSFYDKVVRERPALAPASVDTIGVREVGPRSEPSTPRIVFKAGG